MNTNNTINPHVFHEFYSFIPKAQNNSNSGGGLNTGPSFTISGPFLSSDYLYNRYPFRTNIKPLTAFSKALMGAKLNESDTKPKEFEDEESALKYYKTKIDSLFGKLTEEEYNLLGNNICKNYFIVSESEFYKYKNYFNGMIKSFSLDFSLKVDIQGKFTLHNDCQCPSSSSSSSSSSSLTCPCTHGPTSPHHRPCDTSFFDILTNSLKETKKKMQTFTMYSLVEGPSIEEIDSILKSSNQYNDINNIIDIDNIQKEDEILNSTFEDKNIKSQKIVLQEDCPSQCFCPPKDIQCCEEGDTECQNKKDQYNCEHEFSISVNYDCKYDGSKIFEDTNLENRVGGFDHERYIKFDFKSDQDTQDTLDLRGRGNIYKDNWVFNPDWKSNYFNNSKYFQQNSTLKNDPIFFIGTHQYLTRIRKTMDSTYFGNDITEAINLQKSFNKESQNLGYASLSINGNKNTVLRRAFLEVEFTIQTIFYIKSLNKFMCFINLEIKDDTAIDFYYNIWKDKPEEWTSFSQQWGGDTPHIIPILNARKPILYTTDDNVKICELNDWNPSQCDYDLTCSFPNSVKRTDKYKKEKISLRIQDLQCEFEVFTPESKTDYVKVLRDGKIQSSFCEGGSLPSKENDYCESSEITRTLTFSSPVFTLENWQKEDFSDINTYPPKVN